MKQNFIFIVFKRASCFPMKAFSGLVSTTVVTLGLISCVNTSVIFDYDPATDFNAIKTFAWQSDKQPQTGDHKIDNEIIDRRFRSAITSGLVAKGLTEVNANQAEILLEYQITIKPVINNHRVSGSVGFGKSSGGSSVGLSLGAPLAQHSYDEGTMILGMSEAKTNTLIWRGVAARRIDPSASAQENADKIKKLVLELLDGYPPK